MSVSSHKSKIPVFQGIRTKKPTEVQKRQDASGHPNITSDLNKRSDFAKPKLTESKFTKAEVKSLQLRVRSGQPVFKSNTKEVQKVKSVTKSTPIRFKEVKSLLKQHTEDKNAETKVKSSHSEGKSAHSRYKPTLIDVKQENSKIKSPLIKHAHSRIKSPLTGVKPSNTRVKPPLTEFKPAQTRVKSPLTEVKSSVAQVKSPLTEVKSSVAQVKSPLTEVKSSVAQVKTPLTEVKSSVAQVKSPLTEVKSPLAEVKSQMTEAKLPQSNINSIQTNVIDSMGVKQDDQDIQFEPDQKALESILNNQGIIPDFKTTPKAMSGKVTSGITPIAANRMSMWDSYREFKINVQKHKAMLQHLNIEPSFEPDSKALSTILNGQGISSTTTGMCSRSSMYTSSSRTMMQSYLDHKENIKLFKETLQVLQQTEKAFVTPLKGVSTTTTTTPLSMGLLTPAQQFSVKRSVDTPTHRIAFPALSEAEENEVTPDSDQSLSQRLEKGSNYVPPAATEICYKSVASASSLVKTSSILNASKCALSSQKRAFTPNQVPNESVPGSTMKLTCDKANSMVNPLRNDITNNNQQSLGNQHYSTTAHYRKELFPASRVANILNTPSPNRKHLLSRTPITGSAARVPVKTCQTPIATGIKAPPMRTPVLSSCLKNRDASRTEMVTVSATKTLRWADGHRLSQNT